MPVVVTLFNPDPAAVTVTVINGEPPVDQSALVAQLQADLAAMTAERDALAAKIATAQPLLTDAQAALA